MQPFQIPPVKPKRRRPWGSSHLEDPDYELPEDHHDDEIPVPPPVPHWAVVKKRAFAATTQNSGRPTSSSSTYHGERNMASDGKEGIYVLENGSETKPLPQTNNILEEETFPTDVSSTFQHTYVQAPRTINGHLDLPLQDGPHRFYCPAAMSNVENAGRNSHFTLSSFKQTLQAITDKHGDISKECYFESKYVIATMLEGICMVIQDIEGKNFEQLNIKSLLEYDMFLKDAEKMNFNVKWLRLQLTELLEALKSFVEAKEAAREKTELVGKIEDAKKEIRGRKTDLERLISFIQEREQELDLRTHQGEMLSVKIAGLKTRYQSFMGKPLTIDGLL